jgi:hypothetical protein
VSGRIRTVKPEWLEDELLALASSDARVLSIALVLLADDHGRGRANRVMLAGQVFPGRPREVLAKALEELRVARYVQIYEVEGQSYFAIRNWFKHQKVDHPSKPRVPAPPAETSEKVGGVDAPRETLDNPRESVDVTRASRDPDRGTGTGPDPGSSASPGGVKPGRWKRFPPDFVPNQTHEQIARELGLNLAEQLELIRDHEYKSFKTDPAAALRTWLRNAPSFGGKGQSTPNRPPAPAPNLSVADRRARDAELEAKARKQIQGTLGLMPRLPLAGPPASDTGSGRPERRSEPPPAPARLQ